MIGVCLCGKRERTIGTASRNIKIQRKRTAQLRAVAPLRHLQRQSRGRRVGQIGGHVKRAALDVGEDAHLGTRVVFNVCGSVLVEEPSDELRLAAGEGIQVIQHGFGEQLVV